MNIAENIFAQQRRRGKEKRNENVLIERYSGEQQYRIIIYQSGKSERGKNIFISSWQLGGKATEKHVKRLMLACKEFKVSACNSMRAFRSVFSSRVNHIAARYPSRIISHHQLRLKLSELSAAVGGKKFIKLLLSFIVVY